MGIGLALAATGLFVVRGVGSDPPDSYRSADGQSLRSLLQTDASLPRDAFVLRWTPTAEPATTYRVVLTSEDLHPMADLGPLTATRVTVPATLLADSPAGARVLWRVEATLPGGRVESSHTFTVRMR